MNSTVVLRKHGLPLLNNMPDLIFFTFFVPLVIITVLFSQEFQKYGNLYRRLKKPEFFLPGETPKVFKKDPVKSLRETPMMSIRWWGIVFETHKNHELNRSASRLRLLLIAFVAIPVLHFFLFFINSKLDLGLL